jgi:hypothetical protein
LAPTTTIDLSPILRQINQLESNLSHRITDVGSQVGQVRGDLKLTTDELRELKADFMAFRDRTERIANVQRSETKVVALRAELDRQFGHHGVVRRTSVGILQGFDVGNVSNSTVTSVSEELMIQTPRYWLAPALVTLAAWSRDDETMAERSVREAFSRDKAKTSLFFALVLRRQKRLDPSVRWLRHYLMSLDPSALTREFAVILEAASHDAFGPHGQKVVSDVMTRWCTELRNRQEVVEAQVRRWAGEIGIQRQNLSATTEYAALAHLSPQWPALEQQLEMASALPATIERYAAIKDHDAQLPTILEDMLDDILDQLVTEYDEDELPLKRDVVYHEAVIEEDGDLVRARARADELNKALEVTSDVVSMQTEAAINPEALGVGTQTQRIAIGVGQQDFRTAAGRFCASYRAAAVSEVDLTFGSGHSNYAQSYAFSGCTIRTDEDEAVGIERLRSAWTATFDPLIAAARFKGQWYVLPSIGAAVVVMVMVLVNPIVGVLALLLAGAGIWFMGDQAKKTSVAKVAELERARASAIDHSASLYRDATAQFVDARLVYEELDGHEADLLRLIDTWPTAAPTIDDEEVA